MLYQIGDNWRFCYDWRTLAKVFLSYFCNVSFCINFINYLKYRSIFPNFWSMFIISNYLEKLWFYSFPNLYNVYLLFGKHMWSLHFHCRFTLIFDVCFYLSTIDFQTFLICLLIYYKCCVYHLVLTSWNI